MRKFIVTTTIFKPSVALKKFSQIKDWQLIVVGDLKTPHKLYEKNKNFIYLSPSKQIKISKKLSDLIGWNCIQRRNFGYLYALLHGGDLIASVDDDNIPYENWGEDILLKKKNSAHFYHCKEEVFDPLSIFSFKNLIWHRGYPLELLQNRKKYNEKKFINKLIVPDVQANLWNGHPDIDAINRMSLPSENFKFKLKKPYFSNKISPFNSQNTVFSREAMKNYFLFPHVGRMDDIWAAYYLQSVGFKVIYAPPTVYQNRNDHNIYNDFSKELIGYKNNLHLVRDLYRNSNNLKKYLPDKSFKAFQTYLKLTNEY